MLQIISGMLGSSRTLQLREVLINKKLVLMALSRFEASVSDPNPQRILIRLRSVALSLKLRIT